MQRFLALCFIFLAFTASLFVSHNVFEHMPHLEDELAYLFQAEVFARGDIVIPPPDPVQAYWKPFVVNFNDNRFSKYTPGWSLLLAPGVMMGFPAIINALYAALAIALLYRLGEEIFSADTGIIAVALMTFSPMFLLLNGSLMGHTAALAHAILFVYAYWHLETGNRNLLWGLIAGLALGLLIINRPLTAIAISLPFVLYSGLRLLWVLIRRRQLFWRVLYPLLALATIAILIATLVPLYRYIATGDPTLNTYTLVWKYDKVGFGEGYGRNGHTLERGWRTARADLTLTAVDLFGWQFGGFNSDQRNHLLTKSGAYPGKGYSWILLPFGLIIGLIFSKNRRWTLLLALIPVSIVICQLAYWIGSQRYSTRYYFEGLAAAALISAIPLGWIAQRWQRIPIYIAISLMIVISMNRYTIERIAILYGFNGVTQTRIDEVNARRQTDKPVLVILTGDEMTWRANGTLMVNTSAYLDNDIVLARDRADGRYREKILTRFPDREIIEMQGTGSQSWFVEEISSNN